MTTEELKQVILDYIKDIYKAEYVGKIEVEELNPGYKVSLYIHGDEVPISIMADLPEDDFINFIKEEIRSRKLIKNDYWKIKKVYTYEEILEANGQRCIR